MATTLAEKLRDANPCDGGPTCECESGNYYVSAINGHELYLMAGPYRTHRQAQATKERSLRIADDHDGRAWFMSWGIVKMAGDYTKPGSLNRHGLI